MSVINKMLQELDRRSAMATLDTGAPAPADIRPVDRSRRDPEWFWRIVAALLLVALGWTAWIAYQIQPRSLTTDLAHKTVPRAAASPQVVATAPAPPPRAAVQQPVLDSPPVLRESRPPEATKPAAETSETRAAAGPDRTARKPSLPRSEDKVALPAPAAQRPAPAVALAQAVSREPLVAAPPRVERREPRRTPEQRADVELRRAVTLLNSGRVSEAEEGLAAALALDVRHEAARQALAALLLEHRRLDEARRVLQEGLAVHPGHPLFATVLARIFVEQNDSAAALDVLTTHGAGAAGYSDFHVLHGTVLQRLGRHPEAIQAFERALRLAPQLGPSWVAFGVSLEGSGRVAEAAQAYERALQTGTLEGAVRDYAESRVRALK